MKKIFFYSATILFFMVKYATVSVAQDAQRTRMETTGNTGTATLKNKTEESPKIALSAAKKDSSETNKPVKKEATKSTIGLTRQEVESDK